MDKIDDGIKIVTRDFLVVSDADTGEIIERRNGQNKQEEQNEERPD